MITFKRHRERGLRSMCAVATFLVRRDGVEIGRVQETRRGSGMFFWYSDGVNTCGKPVPLGEAKRQVRDHYKAKENA